MEIDFIEKTLFYAFTEKERVKLTQHWIIRKSLCFFLFLTLFFTASCASSTQRKSVEKPVVIQKPISFGKERILLTRKYMKEHYGKNLATIEIVPQMIVCHWTATNSFSASFNTLFPEKLPKGNRKELASSASLNVSSHYLVDRDGTIYQLMPDNWMARHVIGLNHTAIGIENVGGAKGAENLTTEQVRANARLVKYLKEKYPTIKYLIGHHEYLRFKKHPLWLEKDPNYRTIKPDPGKKFMTELRRELGEKGAS